MSSDGTPLHTDKAGLSFRRNTIAYRINGVKGRTVRYEIREYICEASNETPI